MSTKLKAPIIDLHTCLQGEGLLTGVPHILIRTSGCNLRCMFHNSICDSAYSSFNAEKGKISKEEVVELFKENPQIKHIMLTGGEPSIHKPFIEELRQMFPFGTYHITMESNGTLFPGYEKASMIDLISLSPKLGNSDPNPEKIQKQNIEEDKLIASHSRTRKRIDSFCEWITCAQNFQLKYVISSEEDLKEALEQVAEMESKLGRSIYIKETRRMELIRDHVYLMSEGDCEEVLQKNRKMVAEMAIREGLKYTERLQFVIWGTKREA